tara:strand:- start:35 stop:583 length:549 start_codon:yes stop_codon:yes gene_type:complete
MIGMSITNINNNNNSNNNNNMLGNINMMHSNMNSSMNNNMNNFSNTNNNNNNNQMNISNNNNNSNNTLGNPNNNNNNNNMMMGGAMSGGVNAPISNIPPRVIVDPSTLSTEGQIQYADTELRLIGEQIAIGKQKIDVMQYELEDARVALSVANSKCSAVTDTITIVKVRQNCLACEILLYYY